MSEQPPKRILEHVKVKAALERLGRGQPRERCGDAPPSELLKAIHELRALAHIVDMHQLPKDPESYFAPAQHTTPSLRRAMTPFELNRYLDYCSESLALISKIAALYVQGFQDPVLLDAVDDVEDLTAGFSRKIWQKITILENLGRSLPAEAK